MVDGETSPPQLLTEADLIALMEKHGIGQYSLSPQRVALELSSSGVVLRARPSLTPDGVERGAELTLGSHS